MTSTTPSPNTPDTRWRRFLDWFRAVDDAFEFDPWAREKTQLEARLAAMETTVKSLEARLEERRASTHQRDLTLGNAKR